jgi:drug/metabolite transporter (DMT)-like permease
VGFVGVLVMVSKGDWHLMANLNFNRGDIGAVIGVIGLSAYAIGLRWLPRGLTPLDAAFGITVAGCIAALPAYAAESLSGRPFPLRPETVGAVLLMGTVGSVLGNVIWNIGNQALGANKASIFINLIPVFGVVMAIAFLGETLRFYHIAGFALICAGVCCVLARRFLSPDPVRAAGA